MAKIQKSLSTARGRTPEGEPNPIDVHVGNRIKLRRNILGMSQEKLASSIGLTFQQVQKYERGRNRISASRLWDFAKILGVQVSFFFEEMDEKTTKQSPRMFTINDPSLKKAALNDCNSIVDEIDPMSKVETLELVRAFYKISNRKAAKLAFELVLNLSKSISKDQTEND